MGVGATGASGEPVAGAGIAPASASRTAPSSFTSRSIVRRSWKNAKMSFTPPMPNQIRVASAMRNGTPTAATSQYFDHQLIGQS